MMGPVMCVKLLTLQTLWALYVLSLAKSGVVGQLFPEQCFTGEMASLCL